MHCPLIFTLVLSCWLPVQVFGHEDTLPPLFQGRPLADWIKDLGSKEPKVRLPAIVLMGALGEKARPQVPRLRELSKDADTETRLEAVNALGRIGGDDAFAALLLLAQEEEPAIRQAVEAVLRRFQRTSREHIETLIRLRFHPDGDFSRAALEGLRRPGSWRKEAVPYLVALLTSPREAYRREACDALAAFGKDASDAVPALIQLLDREEHRFDVLHALGKIACQPELCVPVLIAVLKQRRSPEGERIAAIRALGNFGPHARSALPPLREAFDSFSPHVRFAAAEAFLASEGEAPDAVRVLARLVQERDQSMRIRAVQKLIELGPRAKGALPVLREAGNDRDPVIRSLSRQAVMKITGEPYPGVGK